MSSNGRRTSPMALLEDPETIAARRESERMVTLPPNLPPMIGEAAYPSRRPTEEEWKKMTEAVEYATYAPPEAEEEARRTATERVVRSFGIDMSHVRAIYFDPALGDQAQTDTDTGVIRLPASAFQDGPGGLAAFLLHEVTHLNQVVLRGDPKDPLHPNGLAYEVMAYQTAETHAQELRLEEKFLEKNREIKEQVLQWLHPDNRQQLQQTGEYWTMDPSKPSDPKALEEIGAEFAGSEDPADLQLLVRGGRV